MTEWTVGTTWKCNAVGCDKTVTWNKKYDSQRKQYIGQPRGWGEHFVPKLVRWVHFCPGHETAFKAKIVRIYRKMLGLGKYGDDQ